MRSLLNLMMLKKSKSNADRAHAKIYAKKLFFCYAEIDAGDESLIKNVEYTLQECVKNFIGID